MTLTEAEAAAFKQFEQAGWEKAAQPYHDHWGLLSRQSAAAMLDAAKVSTGSHVLDIATGAGYVAEAAARRDAKVIGLDFSATQVALARQTYPHIEFCEGNAEDLPFDDAWFDAVVMGFGMNHMPDPERAVAQAFRVLKPGGRFAFTVWAAPQPGQAFGFVMSAIEKVGVPNPDLPKALPYFQFADPGEVKSLLEGGGFVDATTAIVPQIWQHESPNQVFDAFNEGAVRATALLRSQPAEVRQTIREMVRTEVESLREGDKFIIPVPAALSAARKP